MSFDPDNCFGWLSFAHANGIQLRATENTMSKETKIDDGGPAFARSSNRMEMANGCDLCDSQSGMTLRDFFAAKAMQGLLANPGGPIQGNSQRGWGFTNCTMDHVVGMSFGIADAMLRERAKATPEPTA